MDLYVVAREPNTANGMLGEALFALEAHTGFTSCTTEEVSFR